MAVQLGGRQHRVPIHQIQKGGGQRQCIGCFMAEPASQQGQKRQGALQLAPGCVAGKIGCVNQSQVDFSLVAQAGTVHGHSVLVQQHHLGLGGGGWRHGLRYGLLGLPLAFVALPLYVVLPNHYATAFVVPLAALGALLLVDRDHADQQHAARRELDQIRVRDGEAWRRALQINTYNAYDDYLRNWPRGEWRAEASSAIQQLRRALDRPGGRELSSRFLPISANYPALGRWLARIEALPGFVPMQKTRAGLAA